MLKRCNTFHKRCATRSVRVTCQESNGWTTKVWTTRYLTQVCADSHDERGARLLYRPGGDPLALCKCSARYKEHARRSGFAANRLHARAEFRNLRNWHLVFEKPSMEESYRRGNSTIVVMQTMPNGKPRFPLRVRLQHNYGAFRWRLVLPLSNSGWDILCERRSKMERRNERTKWRIDDSIAPQRDWCTSVRPKETW